MAEGASGLRSGKRLHPELRFLGLAGPGAAFIVISLLLPLLSIVVFSFWRTESYELYADWNLDNYRVLLGEAAYRTFFLRSLVTAAIVTARSPASETTSPSFVRLVPDNEWLRGSAADDSMSVSD